MRDSLVERHQVRWTASLDLVVIDALVDQGLCDVALVDGASVGAKELASRLSAHSASGPPPTLVVWIGERPPGDVWLQLDPSSSTNSVTSALLSAVRHALVHRPDANPSFEIIGRSYAARHLRRAIGPVARSAECALITGPTGVGKRRVAQELHAQSGRTGRLIHVDCESDSVMDELFGEGGALVQTSTTTHAHTVVLQRVHQLPGPVQRRLCSWLRDRTPGIRVVSLSAKDPSDDLHQELYFRLTAVHLRLPGLADRPQDIEPLVEWLLAQSNAGPVNAESMRILCAWSWPGNVSELRSALASAHIESAAGPIEARHLPRRIRANQSLVPTLSVSHDQTLASMEEQTITRALVRLQGNVTEVGRELGISRSTLYRKLRKYGLR